MPKEKSLFHKIFDGVYKGQILKDSDKNTVHIKAMYGEPNKRTVTGKYKGEPYEITFEQTGNKYKVEYNFNLNESEETTETKNESSKEN